jgi:hypothetical protein
MVQMVLSTSTPQCTCSLPQRIQLRPVPICRMSTSSSSRRLVSGRRLSRRSVVHCVAEDVTEGCASSRLPRWSPFLLLRTFNASLRSTSNKLLRKKVVCWCAYQWWRRVDLWSKAATQQQNQPTSYRLSLQRTCQKVPLCCFRGYGSAAGWL